MAVFAMSVVSVSSVINILEFGDLGGVWVLGGRCRHMAAGWSIMSGFMMRFVFDLNVLR